jgi:GNAT superfamily N-acetyltransferase
MAMSNLAEPVVVDRVKTSSDPRFEELVAIYREALPSSERKPSTQLAAMIEKPGYVFLVLTIEGRVVGFAISVCFERADACLIEYMAVAADRRGRGLGNLLFNSVVEMPEVSDRYLLAEVESEMAPSDDHLDRVRRKRFYRRLGCMQVEGLDYLMPAVSSTTPPAMNIMVRRRNLPGEVSKGLLRMWLEDIYVNVYSKAASDPRIDKMLENLPERPGLI